MDEQKSYWAAAGTAMLGLIPWIGARQRERAARAEARSARIRADEAERIALREQINALLHRLHLLEQRIDARDAEIMALEMRLEEKASRIAALEAELNAQNSHIAALYQQIEELGHQPQLPPRNSMGQFMSRSKAAPD